MQLDSEIVERLTHLGWAKVAGVSSVNALLKIATQLGRPIPSPSGELIKNIRPVSSIDAIPGTFSSRYGRGAFPFHTDTAFWTIPARYVLLRQEGDCRRETRIMTIDSLFRESSKVAAALQQSTWIVKTPGSARYCSMQFHHNRRRGIRYDPACMIPANPSARLVDTEMRRYTSTAPFDCAFWRPCQALLLDNWRVLHSRGPSPKNEGPRVIQRIYVEDELGT